MEFFRKTSTLKIVDPLEPIPFGEAQESDWGAWDALVASQDAQVSQPALLKENDSLQQADPLKSVSEKSS